MAWILLSPLKNAMPAGPWARGRFTTEIARCRGTGKAGQGLEADLRKGWNEGGCTRAAPLNRANCAADVKVREFFE